jgi:hypothetical protein
MVLSCGVLPIGNAARTAPLTPQIQSATLTPRLVIFPLKIQWRIIARGVSVAEPRLYPLKFLSHLRIGESPYLGGRKRLRAAPR